MFMRTPATIFLAVLMQASLGFAVDETQHGEGPCKQVVEACEKAGFIKGQWKVGKGLWVDCVNPVMQGKSCSKPAIAVPSVDGGLVSACKAKHPKFGTGKTCN
jgi:hypothetical protein